VTPSHIILLFSVAVIAGALNSVAGGGSFLSFPALMFTGVTSTIANATNTTALWPGTIASTSAYRKSMSSELVRRMIPLVVSTVFGSLIGAQLLLKTKPATFDRLVPWLLLVGTLFFNFRSKLTGWAGSHAGTIAGQRNAQQGPSLTKVALVTLAQGVLGIYVGYFGAGVGILMLPLLALMGVEDIHAMSGVRTGMITCGNTVAIIVFILAHAVLWPQMFVMTIGAIVGGYGGAHYAQKMKPQTISYVVLVIGYGMATYFFWRTWIA
jgi:uncharacterized membrane protein YfcA